MGADADVVVMQTQAQDGGNMPAIPEAQRNRFCFGHSEHMPIAARLSDYTPRELEWVWPGRMPLGALTLLVGDPGLGKSFLTIHVAARITRGLCLPQLGDEPLMEQRQEPGSVILLSAEDSVVDTIYPRFRACGGDPKRLTLLRAVGTYDEDDLHLQWQFSLAKDLAALEELLDSHRDCRLIVIDPISAHLGSGTSNNTEMRRILAPLVSLAARRRVAVLAVTHLCKGKQGPLVQRAIGSIALAAAARSVLVVLPHPREAAWRIVAPIKSNLSQSVGPLRFRIGSEEANRPATVLWNTTPTGESSESMVGAADRTTYLPPSASEAVEWLKSMLGGGPRPAAELKQLAKADGISERTLLRAKSRLQLETKRTNFGAAGRWLWSLPGYHLLTDEWDEAE